MIPGLSKTIAFVLCSDIQVITYYYTYYIV